MVEISLLGPGALLLDPVLGFVARLVILGPGRLVRVSLLLEVADRHFPLLSIERFFKFLLTSPEDLALRTVLQE